MNISIGNYFIQWRRQICNPENNRFVNNFVVYLNSNTYIIIIIIVVVVVVVVILQGYMSRSLPVRFGTKIF